jgi:hypothetical protein
MLQEAPFPERFDLEPEPMPRRGGDFRPMVPGSPPMEHVAGIAAAP